MAINRSGDDVGYHAVHKRLYVQRGKAKDHPCAVCGCPAAHWAFDEPTGFSVDLDRYSPMCVSCHAKQEHRGDRLPHRLSA